MDLIPEEAAERQDQRKPVLHRMTVRCSYYHQVHGGDAQDIQIAYDTSLSSDEQMYQRNYKVDKSKSVLDTGWIGQQNLPVRLLVVENKSKTGTLLIGMHDVFFARIEPLQHLAFQPILGAIVQIIASEDVTPICVSVIPG